jgi:hypothetical protein
MNLSLLKIPPHQKWCGGLAVKNNDMKHIELKPNTTIRCKGFDISIGREAHQIALISHSTGEFTPFSAIKKGGRLAKIKRKFKLHLSSSTTFFWEFMGEQDTRTLIKMLS